MKNVGKQRISRQGSIGRRGHCTLAPECFFEELILDHQKVCGESGAIVFGFDRSLSKSCFLDTNSVVSTVNFTLIEKFGCFECNQRHSDQLAAH